MDRTHLDLASVTKYVKINASEAVTVEIHVASRGCSYKWFKDQHMQEALIVAYKVLQIYYSSSDSKKTKKDLSKFCRSGDLRILSKVKPVTTSAVRHLLVLDERIYDVPSALPNYGLINVNGKKVFPYLHEHTTACRYTPYKVLSLVVSLYLDSLELSSIDGVVKINRSLHPGQPIVSDIVSLFKSLPDTTDEIPESHQPSLPLTVSSRKAKPLCSKGPLPLKLKTSHASNSGQTTLTTFRKGRGKQTSSLSTLQDINTETNLPNSFIYDPPPTKHHLHTQSPPTCPLLSTSPLNDDHNNSQDLFDSLFIHDEQNSVADTSSHTNESSSNNWISRSSRPPPDKTKTKRNIKRPNLSAENDLSTEEEIMPSAKRLSHDENDLEMIEEEEDKVGNRTGSDLLALMEKMSERAKELEEKRNEYSKFDEEIQQIKAKYEMDRISEVINISSGDEDEVNENDDHQLSWKKTYRAGPKRKEAFKQLFSEYNGINELTELTLMKWIKIRKETLVQIFTGKIPSERHEMFHKGKRERACLQYQVNTVMFTSEQLKFFTDTLHGVFCPRSDINFNYLWLVLIPEAVVHLIMDYHQLNYNEAENKMYHYHPIKIETIDL